MASLIHFEWTRKSLRKYIKSTLIEFRSCTYETENKINTRKNVKTKISIHTSVIAVTTTLNLHFSNQIYFSYNSRLLQVDLVELKTFGIDNTAKRLEISRICIDIDIIVFFFFFTKVRITERLQNILINK